MLYVSVIGEGPYVYRGRQCTILAFSNKREGRQFARDNSCMVLKRTACVTHQGKVLHVSSIAVMPNHTTRSSRGELLNAEIFVATANQRAG